MRLKKMHFKTNVVKPWTLFANGLQTQPLTRKGSLLSLSIRSRASFSLFVFLSIAQTPVPIWEPHISPGNTSLVTCVWGGTQFIASKFYAYCFRRMQADEAFGWIWKSKCTMKWKVFSCLILADRINTRDMQRIRHYILQNNNYSCLLCSHPPDETLEQLFFFFLSLQCGLLGFDRDYLASLG